MDIPTDLAVKHASERLDLSTWMQKEWSLRVRLHSNGKGLVRSEVSKILGKF